MQTQTWDIETQLSDRDTLTMRYVIEFIKLPSGNTEYTYFKDFDCGF